MLIDLSKDNILLIKYALRIYEDELRDQLNLCRTKLVVPILDELKEIEKVRTVLGED